MNYKHIPQDPKDLTLPGLTFKSRRRRKYERAMWPEFRLDQFTLLPKEELAPKKQYVRVGDRLYNLSKIGKWSDKTLWDFFFALQNIGEDDSLFAHEWVLDAIAQWQFVTSALWREMFSEDQRGKRLPRHLEILKTRFVEWAGNLSPEGEVDALKQIGHMEENRRWRMLRLFIEARKNKRMLRDEYPKRPIAEDDPFWPAIRDILKKRCDDYTEETVDGDDFYDFARKLLGPSGMRYYKHFNDGAHWR